jgi:capsule polysaccharide export protein KpsE/RkpR
MADDKCPLLAGDVCVELAEQRAINDQDYKSIQTLRGEIKNLRQELLIKKQRIRFLEKANESWAAKFDRLGKK